MLHDSNDQTLFPTLPDDEIARLKPYGRIKTLPSGAALFQEGDMDYAFYVVLEGRVRITKQVSGEQRVLTIHQPGQFTGEMSMLSGAGAIANGHALGAVTVLEIDAATFRQLMGESTSHAHTILGAMVERARDVERQTRQQEKLAALGKLSAGLAHELNNPAAAVLQAARQLHESVEQGQVLTLHYDSRFTTAQREALIALLYELLSHRDMQPPLSPLAQSDREDELTDWLERHDIGESWRYVATLAETGMHPWHLDSLATALPQLMLGSALNWLATTLTQMSLARQVMQDTTRISDLVAAMKEYSQMDRASYQQIDIHQGIESTLTVLAHKIAPDITISRDYDQALPTISGYGGELNQVWTHLIENALDALRGHGHLRIHTSHDSERVNVEIIDNGPGIPPAIQARIWEPFFTTKGVGEGTGLGLDVVRRVVTQRHQGEVFVRSQPGDTCFEVYLPIQPAHERIRD